MESFRLNPVPREITMTNNKNFIFSYQWSRLSLTRLSMSSENLCGRESHLKMGIPRRL